MATSSALWSLLKMFLTDDASREFFIYVVFVVVFSVISFSAKPGVSQYHLNHWAQQTWASQDNENVLDFTEVTSTATMYEYLETTIAKRLFPETNDADEPLWALPRVQVRLRAWRARVAQGVTGRAGRGAGHGLKEAASRAVALRLRCVPRAGSEQR